MSSCSSSEEAGDRIACPHCQWQHVPKQGPLYDGVYKSTCGRCHRGFTFKSTSLPRSSISFTVNGKQCTVSDADASTRLNSYIRDTLKLPGTKYMCYEGGCGCCVVAATFYDQVFQKKRTMAVNSCLQPLYACNGWEIETTEGIGGRVKGFHPVQEKIADMNGSQCGYCTPGMVMSMYSLLKDNPKPTEAEVENVIDGNICRCTGYRPILDAMKTFALESADTVLDIEDLERKVKLCQKNGNQPCRGDCAQREVDPVYVQLRDAQWNTPTTVPDLLKLLSSMTGKKVRLVVGNTGAGVYKSDGGYDMYIDMKEIAQLSQFGWNEARALRIGCNVSLTNLIDVLQQCSKSSGFAHLTIIADHIKNVANKPVRNVGSWAGNLKLKVDHPDFVSDIQVILEAAKAQVQVVAADGTSELHSPGDLSKVSWDQKFIASLSLPETSAQDVFITYKVKPSSQNAHAYVSAGFWMKLDSTQNYKVLEKPNIVYAGINPTFLHASKTEDYLTGKVLTDSNTLLGAYQMLLSEVNPNDDPVLPSVEYRKQLAVALLYKFVLHACGDKVPASMKSGAGNIERPISTGQEVYDTDKTKWPIQQPMPKISARLQASGEAEYTDNLPDYPGQLFAEFVLSNVASATIDKIDSTDALKMPGVVKVVTHSDIPGVNSFVTPYNKDVLEEVLCSGEVGYAGQAVAMVLAESKGVAMGAARAVKVSYKDVKKPILSLKDGITAKSFYPKQGDDLVVGNAEDAISKSPKVIEGNIGLETQYHFTMETQCCACIPTDIGIDVHASTQWPDGVQQAVAQVLGVSNTGILIKVKRLGGGYGGKIDRNHHISAACALGTHLTNRPVRMHMTLGSNMAMVGKRFPYYAEYQIGAEANGKLNGIKVTYYCDSGSSVNGVTVLGMYEWGDNAYKCDNWHMIPIAVRTNTPSNTSCRSPGSLPAIFIMETMMEHVAEALGLDPLAVKTLNLYNKGDVTPGGDVLPYCSIRDLVPQLSASAQVEQRKSATEAFNKSNRWRKRGLGVVPIKFGIGWAGAMFNVQVAIYNGDGTVAITHGGIEMGQGINTKVIQVCAAQFGIPITMVKVFPTDTMANANTGVTGGSIGSELCCSGVLQCCDMLKKRMSGVREQLGRNTDWKTLVQKCFAEGIDLMERYWLYPKTAHPSAYMSYGVTCAEVEVDTLTGQSQINRVDMLFDCGTSINPELDVGQCQGGFVMGLGYMLQEKIRFHPDTGVNLSNTTWEYKVPSSHDIPVDFRVELLKNAPNPLGVLGSKASGEPPMCMSCSALFALKHAVTAVRQDQGSNAHFTMGAPTTVEDVFNCCLPDYKNYVL